MYFKPIRKRPSLSKYVFACLVCLSSFFDSSDSLADPLLITQELATIQEELFRLTPESPSDDETPSTSSLTSNGPTLTGAELASFESLLAYQSVLLQLRNMAEKSSKGLVLALPDGKVMDVVTPALQDNDPKKPLIDSDDRDKLKRVLALRKKLHLKVIPMDFYAMIRITQLLFPNPTEAEAFTRYSNQQFMASVDAGSSLPVYTVSKMESVVKNAPGRYAFGFPSFLNSGQNFFFEVNYDSKNQIYLTFPDRKLGRGNGKLAFEVFSFKDWTPYARLTVNEKSAADALSNRIREFEAESRLMVQIGQRIAQSSRDQVTIPVDVAPGQMIAKRYAMDFYDYLVGNPKRKIQGHQLRSIQKGKLLMRIAQTVADLHEIDVVHKDLKFENIFVESRRDQKGDIELWPVCADFGFSEKLCRHEHFKRRAASGTVDYYAPEVGWGKWAGFNREEQKIFAKRADVFSLGVLAHILIEGRPPSFNDEQGRDNLAIPPLLDALEAREGLALKDLLYIHAFEHVEDRFDAKDLAKLLEIMLKNPISLRSSPGGKVDGLALETRVLLDRSLGKASGFLIHDFKNERDAVRHLTSDVVRKGDFVLWARAVENTDFSQLAITFVDGTHADRIMLKTQVLADLNPDNLEGSISSTLEAMRLVKMIR